MDELRAHLDLPLGTDASAAARRAVESTLHSWGLNDPDWLLDAVIIVSELVVNAIRHGGGLLALELHQTGDGYVILSAVDPSPQTPRRRDADQTGGRGVAIIDALAADWGCHDHDGGKRVWVRLAAHPDPGDPAASDRPVVQGHRRHP